MVTFLIAVAIGAIVLGISLWVIRALATLPPPEPDPEAVVEVAVDYRCSVCGMRLTVTQAQDGTQIPPRHCREQMAPV